MSFMYEGHPSADHVITAYSPTAFSAAGQTCYMPIPYRAYITECGFIPITSSVTTQVTLQVSLSSVAGGSFVSGGVVASGTGTFASGALTKGAVASVAVSNLLVPKGSQLEFTTSGGTNSLQGGCTIYAVVRRAESQ